MAASCQRKGFRPCSLALDRWSAASFLQRYAAQFFRLCVPRQTWSAFPTWTGWFPSGKWCRAANGGIQVFVCVYVVAFGLVYRLQLVVRVLFALFEAYFFAQGQGQVRVFQRFVVLTRFLRRVGKRNGNGDAALVRPFLGQDGLGQFESVRMAWLKLAAAAACIFSLGWRVRWAN